MSALPKEYQAYARQMLVDVLNARISDMAPGSQKPYVRAEFQFPSDGSESGSSHADRVQGKTARVSAPIDSEIRAFANATRDAVAYALNDNRYIVETAVLTDQGGQPGTHVSLLIYDNAMGSSEQLAAKLNDSRQAVLRRFETLCPPSPNPPNF